MFATIFTFLTSELNSSARIIKALTEFEMGLEKKKESNYTKCTQKFVY